MINIIQKNFLELNINDYFGSDQSNILTIGNPPFGKRSKLAITFFNKSAEYSHTIAFIVPLQFQKWSVQKQLNPNFKLIYSEVLEPNSFTFNNKDSNIRCCFQIWTNLNVPFQNLRVVSPPETSHKDFQMYQYNNTIGSRKYFDYDWDFCVPRQGFYDYTQLITNKNECNPKIQYIFFKTNNPDVLKRLKSLDFESLSKMNTTIPGFGKADVVQAYLNLCGEGVQ
jgi:hypothetical protein